MRTKIKNFQQNHNEVPAKSIIERICVNKNNDIINRKSYSSLQSLASTERVSFKKKNQAVYLIESSKIKIGSAGETINHLLLHCPIARVLGSMVFPRMLWSLLLAGQENSENIEMGLFGTWFLTVWCGAFGGKAMPRFLKAPIEQFMSWRWPSYRLFLGGQMHPAFPFLLPWLICLIVVAFVLFSFYLFSHFPQYTSYVLWFLFCTVLFFYQRSLFTYQKKKDWKW